MTRLESYIDDNHRQTDIFNVGEPSGTDAVTLVLSGAGEASVPVPAGRTMCRYISDEPFFVTRDQEATVPSVTQDSDGMTYVPADRWDGDNNLVPGSTTLHFIRESGQCIISIKFYD